MSCLFGHLKVIKYLINYANSINSPINIHADDDFAFYWSCAEGNLAIVEYLINYANLYK